MSHTDTTPATAEQIVSMGVRQAREAIDQIDDITLLEKIIAAEQAGKARKSLIGIARLRADGLRESGEAVISVDEAAEREAMVGITLPTGITVPADLVSIQIGDNRAEGGSQVAQDAPAAADEAPAEGQAAPEPEPTQDAAVEPAQGDSADDCARAFFGALRQGNAALVAALLAEVRREDADDEAMAEAIIRAYGATQPPRRARPARSTGATTAGRATLDCGKAEGLTFTFTRSEWTGRAAVNPDGSLTVLKGSKVNPDHKRGWAAAKNLKAELKAAKRMKDDGTLKADVTVPSPTAAAVFVCGDSANGIVSWRTEDGRNLREVCG